MTPRNRAQLNVKWWVEDCGLTVKIAHRTALVARLDAAGLLRDPHAHTDPATIDRVARALFAAERDNPRTPWDQQTEATREDYRRLAAVALRAAR